MRSAPFAAVLFTVLITVQPRHSSAQSHESNQADPQHSHDVKVDPETKRNPKGPKPENQPGAVMNAEELAASHADHHEFTTYQNGGVLPQGWRHRFDLPDMKLENILFVRDKSGMHVTSGPPGIYYDPAMSGNGSYVVGATFTQLSKGTHMEGYGPFVGGGDLEKDGQHYTYFLLRQDGKYLIKQRVGLQTKGVMDWTTSPAIKSFDADGRMTNDLTIKVDANSVRFLINGVEVDRKPRGEVDAEGIAGLRVNHNLDLMIKDFAVVAGQAK